MKQEENCVSVPPPSTASAKGTVANSGAAATPEAKTPRSRVLTEKANNNDGDHAEEPQVQSHEEAAGSASPASESNNTNSSSVPQLNRPSSPAKAAKSKSAIGGVGSAKLVRKHCTDRHRILKQGGPLRLTVSTGGSSSPGRSSEGKSPNRILFRSANAPPREFPMHLAATSPSSVSPMDEQMDEDFSPHHQQHFGITRIVTDDRHDQQATTPASSCSSKGGLTTPGSLDGEESVRHPFRQVQAREDCINPVSRILWDKSSSSDEESMMDDTAVEQPFIQGFRVVSPMSSSSSALPKASTIARPLAVRPMLLA